MPLLMDLKCPVEFVSTEITRDSAGHAQAYLTFFNLGTKTVEGLRAMVTLEDERGQTVDIRPLRHRGLNAPGRSLFTLCIAADRLPYFENARAMIHAVYLAEEETYRLDEEALMDCTVQEEPPGDAKNALIGVAGADAVCYASERTGAWVCLCGRYNENSRSSCVRCRRSRRQVFALTPERAIEEYANLRRAESERVEAGKIDAHRQAQKLRRQRRIAYERRVKKDKQRILFRRIVLGALGAAMLLGIGWLMMQ